MPPARKAAVVICMDARILPSHVLGLKEGDAHVIRNAGGRTAEAVRSLVISQQLLGTREIYVVHHTDCGMLTFSDPELTEIIKKNLGVDAAGPFLSFKGGVPELENSVREDVALLAAEPLIMKGTPIVGLIYDVANGKLREVAKAER